MLHSNYDLDRYLDISDKTKIMQINLFAWFPNS